MISQRLRASGRVHGRRCAGSSSRGQPNAAKPASAKPPLEPPKHTHSADEARAVVHQFMEFRRQGLRTPCEADSTQTVHVPVVQSVLGPFPLRPSCAPRPSSVALTEGCFTGSISAAFSRIYAEKEWLARPNAQALSGLGSSEEATGAFREYLETFLKERHFASVVDAGCGHWPSGYQRCMHWQNVHYTGIDVVDDVLAENKAYFDDRRRADHGFASTSFQRGDLCEELPRADLLLVKDVLMHLPNQAVHAFLESNVNSSAPRFRAVLVVQNDMPMPVRRSINIEPGQLMSFDISQPPFNANFKTVFRWQSDEPKIVQLWESR
mmetsp:Transcript_6225/g.17371  ORF Transcript_6225/g.17371 Transcript_6225/m.17371 type:complete len:323 (-) Transcript_6225:129-1097(-)